MVQDACDTQYQDGPRVAKHCAQQLAVELPIDFEQIRHEEQRDESCTEQIDEEHVKDGRLAQQHEVNQVQGDVQGDEQQLQRGKTDGPFLESQIAEGNGLQGIKGHNDSHHQQIVGML